MESIVLKKVFAEYETNSLSKFKLDILNQTVTHVPQLLPLVQKRLLTSITKTLTQT